MLMQSSKTVHNFTNAWLTSPIYIYIEKPGDSVKPTQVYSMMCKVKIKYKNDTWIFSFYVYE